MMSSESPLPASRVAGTRNLFDFCGLQALEITGGEGGIRTPDTAFDRITV